MLVGDRVAPLGSDLFLGDPAGDVGDDRSPSGQFAGFFVQFEEGGQFDLNVDGSPVRARSLRPGPVEEIEQEVGPDLVEGPRVAGCFQLVSKLVDPSGGSLGSLGGQLVSTEVGGPIRIGF